MRTLICYFMIVLFIITAKPVVGDDSRVIKSNLFEIIIESVETDKSFPAYIGKGKSLCNPMGGIVSGMSAIFMAKEDDGKTYTYMAGKTEAKDNTILVKTTVEVKNISIQDQYLAIGDIRLDYGTPTDFLAVGYGEYPFIKEGTMKAAISKEQIKIEPNNTRTLTYIFGVPSNTLEARIVFKGKQSVSVNFEKK